MEPAKRAHQAYQTFEFPTHLTMTSLLEFVAEFRGKPVEVRETPKLNGLPVCGLWVPAENRERVYHAVSRGPLHRQQLVLHELSHMLLRHELYDSANWQGLAAFKYLSAERVNKALARGNFSTDEERTAEAFADLLAAALREAPREIHRYEEIFE